MGVLIGRHTKIIRHGYSPVSRFLPLHNPCPFSSIFESSFSIPLESNPKRMSTLLVSLLIVLVPTLPTLGWAFYRWRRWVQYTRQDPIDGDF